MTYHTHITATSSISFPEAVDTTPPADRSRSPGGSTGEAEAARCGRHSLVRRTWEGADDRTAGELLRRRLVDLPTPGSPDLILGRHVIRAIDLGGGRHIHAISSAR